MAADAATVRHMAKLARLDVPTDRIEPLTEELTAILGHMAAIAAWDISAVAHDEAQISATRRPDTPEERSDGQALVALAAACQEGEVIVPRVIDAE